MRGKRSRPWRPARAAGTLPRLEGAEADADARVNASLRALARLLARQAAREVFERTVTAADSDRTFDEGRE